MIYMILVLALVGFLTWLVVTYVPMVEPIKKLLVIVVVIGCVLYVLNAFGVLNGGWGPPVPQVHR